MTRILYKLASRERPTKLIATIQNVYDFAEHYDFLIIVSLDEDDKSCNNDEVLAQLSMFSKVIVKVDKGTGSKIEAINRSISEVEEWDIIFGIADDFKFVVKGFDKIVIGLFEVHFKNRKGLLHLNDGTLGERLITMPIMNRELYDWFGYLYNPIFITVYADNEQMDICKTIGAYHYEPMILARHYHRAWGLAENDALYDRNEHVDLYSKDCETYNNRRRINFGLPL